MSATQEVTSKPDSHSAAPGAAGPQQEIGPQPEPTELLDSVVWDLLPEALQAPFEFLASYPALLLLFVVILGYTVGKLFQFVLTRVGKALTRRTATDFDDKLLQVARGPALTVPFILALFIVTAIVPLAGFRETTVNLLASVLLFSLLRAALRACHIFLELLSKRKDSIDIIQTRTLPMFDMASKLIIVAVAGYVLLLIWGIDPTAWLASAGVIGIAVGFAARDTLANLFSGIFIVADAPYQIGDYVVLDTGERGEVTHVGLRSTRLLTRDDVEVTIPNAIIANAKIINESGGPSEKYRIRIPVGVAYGSDVDQVTDVLNEIAHECAEIQDIPNPRVRMRGFGNSSLDFELLGWVNKPVLRGRVTDELLKTIYKRFQAEGISIPFPQTDVYLHRMDKET